MKPTGHDLQPLRVSRPDDAIDEAMFAGETPRPPTGQVAAQWLRLADTEEWSTLNFAD